MKRNLEYNAKWRQRLTTKRKIKTYADYEQRQCIERCSFLNYAVALQMNNEKFRKSKRFEKNRRDETKNQQGKKKTAWKKYMNNKTNYSKPIREAVADGRESFSSMLEFSINFHINFELFELDVFYTWLCCRYVADVLWT